MKLDFNFNINFLDGTPSKVVAKNSIMYVLNYGNVKDRRYLEKKKSWAESLKAGILECDKTDAKELSEWILESDLHDFAKIGLTEFIDSKVNGGKG